MTDIPQRIVGINGFGRIGRMCLRVCLEKQVQVALINDPFMTTEHMIYLFKHDSTHGSYHLPIERHDDIFIVIDGIRIATSQIRVPKQIPWKERGVTYVIEASGLALTPNIGDWHIHAGARKVIITAPCTDVPMFVFGVNHTNYNPVADNIVSASCCTTNCAAPIVKIMNDKFEVIEAMVTSIHAVNAYQNVLDGPLQDSRCQILWRDGRGALQNIIPCMSGANKSLGIIFPQLQCKITAITFRVPVANVSLCDMTFRIHKDATYEEVKTAMRTAAEGEMRNILGYTEEECVSSDFNHTSYSCIFDANAGIPQTSNFIKIVAWYDNEYGYASRVIDLLMYMYNVGIEPVMLRNDILDVE